jgi:alpha-L-rhamnosidase
MPRRPRVTSREGVRGLRTNGEIHPLGVDEAPLLSWAPDERQRYLNVVVNDDHDETVWDSGVVASARSELRSEVPLVGRAVYTWRVRVSHDAQHWSSWSDAASWEAGLLGVTEWDAEWIALPVPAAHRNLISTGCTDIEWASEGDVLTQMFDAPGPVAAVHADLLGELLTDVAFTLAVVAQSGRIVATETVDGEQHIWDRFMHFVEVEPPAPPGRYELRLSVNRGNVGWRLGADAELHADDGVSPLRLSGRALTDGRARDGVRATAVESRPAPNPVFRATFAIDEPVQRARLSIAALGNGIVKVNGQTVGTGVLDPAPTDYCVRVLYRTWDVTHALRPGRNEVEVQAGRGTFAARGANIWGWNLAPWHAEPMVKARLDWRGLSGKDGVQVTGKDWEARAGSTLSDLLYCGETSVSRDSQPAWVPATEVAGPTGDLRSATLPPIREKEAYLPVTATPNGPSSTLYDFGTVLTGRARMCLRGHQGSVVRVSYGEDLDSDGHVATPNALAAGAIQVDTHVFETFDEITDWSPRFGYRGFRWVEVLTEGAATASDVTAHLLHTDVETMGEFDTTEPVLRWTDAAFKRTFLNNLHGFPSDTPTFEKNGWTADAMLATEAILHQVDVRTTFGKWLQDHADSQDAAGVVPQIVPTPGFGRAADPAWSGSSVVIPWQLYWEYGDIDILVRNAAMVRRYCDALISIAGDRPWPMRSWGDWLAPGYELAPEGSEPAATMMMVSVLQHASWIMAALDRSEEAERYSHAAGQTAAAYHDAYFDERAWRYGRPRTGYRQTMNILPLAFDAVPAEHRVAVGQSLVQDLEHRTNGHLDAGALGSRHLLQVLSGLGRDDLALTVATQRTPPGWGSWYVSGESTLRESWDEKARSRNHYFLGGALSWVHQRVGGLRPTSPGWESFEVNPLDDERVSGGRLSHRTVYGDAQVTWQRDESGLDIAVRVPGGATATLNGPDGVVELSQGEHHIRRTR